MRFQVTTVKHVKGLLNMMWYTVIKTLIMSTLNLINLPLVRPSKGDEMGEASSMGRRNAYEIRVANCQYK
jgi:preprotein translocase subunit SecG